MALRRTPRLPLLLKALPTVSLIVGCNGSGVVAEPPVATPTATPTPTEAPTATASPTSPQAGTPTPTEATPSSTEATPTGTPDAGQVTPTAVDPGDLTVPGAYRTIQAAIDAAREGDEVKVSAGTWVEDIDFKGKAITVRGVSGPGATILRGTGDGSIVSFTHAEGEDSRLTGFTLTGGIGTLDEGSFRVGGAVFVASATPSIDNCLITGNRADYGGGIGVEVGGIHLDQVRFTANVGESYGGAISVRNAHLDARRMILWANEAGQGGAVYVNDAVGQLTNTLFAGNQAQDAGGAISLRYAETEFTLANNVFVENTSPLGSAVYYFASEAAFVSNIVTSSEGAAALYLDSDNFTPVVTNNDVYGNPAGNYGGSFRNLTGRDGNIATDAQFENYSADGDPFNDLLTLSEGSPCIDAGPEGQDWADPDGSRNDMGMYGGPSADGRAYTDQDGDGMPDLWEDLNGLDSTSDDAGGDLDGDGLTNLAEYQNGTQVGDPDTDHDGVNDGDEIAAGSDPKDDRDNRPIADAGQGGYIEPGEEGVLDGTASSDPNDDPLTYQWTLIFAPSGSGLSQASIVDADQATARFTSDVEGSYGFQLVVSDGRAESLPDEVVITTAGTWYVPGPLTRSIQEAIDRASQGQRILVAPGTYDESLVFDDKRVRVESLEGPKTTIIRSAGLKPVATFKGKIGGGGDGNVGQIVGFTLTGGLGDPLEPFELYGGGIFIKGAAPLVENCIITRNGASYGGGVAVVGGGLTLRGSVVQGNGAESAGGAIYIQQSLLPVLVEGNTIAGNAANYGGGVYLNDFPIATLRNNFFYGNYADSGNSAGAIDVGEGDERVLIANNVIMDNDAPAVGGIMIDGTPTVVGNVVAWNSGAGVSVVTEAGSEPVFSYNDVYDNAVIDYLGRAQIYANRDGNISADPQFARYVPGLDEQNPVLFLQPGSPLIDAGPPDAAYRDPNGSRNDMGIYGGPGASQAAPDDEDEDGIADYWEEDHGLNPTVDDSGEDPDGDGLDNKGEFDAGSDPHLADTDGDGVSDGDEVLAGGDPADASDNQPVAVILDPYLYVDVGVPAALDGSSSTDPQDDALTYRWTLTRKPVTSSVTTASIGQADQAVASLTPDVAGAFEVQLVVSDGLSSSPPATLTLYASETLIVGDPGTHSTIQAAIDASADNGQIRVRAGTYVEDLDFHGKTLIVESMDGPETTTIRGTSVGSVLTFTSGETTASVLRGFTVTGGTGHLEPADAQAGTPARLVGGGVYVVDSSPTLDDLIIQGNSAEIGGGIFVSGGAPVVTRALIQDNDAADLGGAVALEATGAQILGSIIRGNRGSDAGGVYVADGTPLLSNLILQENKATSATGVGGIAVDGCQDDLGIVNVTAVGNSGRGASNLWLTACTGRVVGSIFAFGASGPGVAVSGEVEPWFAYNDVSNNPAGDYGGDWDSLTGNDGNKSQDPLFQSYTSGDGFSDNLHLKLTSPCVDAGDPSPVANDTNGTRNDMGAYGGPDPLAM